MTCTTDLSSIQRDYIRENFPEIKLTKSPKDIIEVINVIFYIAKTGCQWNMLPGNCPSWRTCYNFFRKWTDAGIFAKILGSMLAVARQRLERKPDVKVVVVDSQSVRSGLPQWLDNFRRVCRNYEKYLQTAKGMTFIGCVMFLSRFFT